jgi:PRC-barrel domain protein
MRHQDIAQWHGKELVDRDGERIGKLEDVYVDVETDEPMFGTVKEGLIGRHLTFVPLAGLTIGPDNLQVTVSKEQVKEAPNIETEGDELSQTDESSTPPDTKSGRRLARRVSAPSNWVEQPSSRPKSRLGDQPNVAGRTENVDSGQQRRNSRDCRTRPCGAWPRALSERERPPLLPVRQARRSLARRQPPGGRSQHVLCSHNRARRECRLWRRGTRVGVAVDPGSRWQHPCHAGLTCRVTPHESSDSGRLHSSGWRRTGEGEANRGS